VKLKISGGRFVAPVTCAKAAGPPASGVKITPSVENNT